MSTDSNTIHSEGYRVTLIGGVCNVGLIALKLVAGVVGHSEALIADAVHSLSDLLTDLITLAGFRIGRKGADTNHHFGHGRVETFFSSLTGILLILGGGYIAFHSIMSIRGISHVSPTILPVVVACLSIPIKEVLFQWTRRVGQRLSSTSLMANAWHHRSDALSSVAVLVGVGGAYLRPQWVSLDAWAALVVSFFIFKAGAGIILRAYKEFTDVAPGTSIQEKIRQCALEINGVQGLHDLKIRSSGGRYQMEVHVVVDGEITVRAGHKIAKEVEQCLISEFSELGSVIVHVDPDEKNGAEKGSS